jgi:hypothetical protein
MAYVHANTTEYGYDITARPSVEAYESYNSNMMGAVRGEEPSRTMQLAYTDPCES